MIPAGFEYTRAKSLDDALKLIATHGDAKVIAGGQSLLPLMKLRLARPERLIDIGRVKELKGIRKLSDGRVAIGALTTYAEMLGSKELSIYRALTDALPSIADLQVRNRGTIGGAVAHADPAADLPAVLLVLEAEFVARSAKGERRIPATAFFEGPFATALRSDELLTEVVLPADRKDAASAYVSIEQKASGYAIAGVAAVVFKGGKEGARVALTGVSDTAYRAAAVEKALGGKQAAADLAAAAKHATDGVTVNGDIHADAEYRASLAVTCVRRALEAAIARL